jgi:hypothetical protein
MTDYVFSARDKFDEVQREIGRRIKVYTQLIRDGMMSKNVADRQTDIMRAIAEDYVTLMLRGAMREDQSDTERRQERGEVLPDRTTILSGG